MRNLSTPRSSVAFVGLCLAVSGLPVFYAFTAFDTFDVLRDLGISSRLQAIAGLLLSAIVFAALAARLRPANTTDRVLLGAALALLAAAAFLVDAHYPAKYIHLPQYALLGGIVAWLLRGRFRLTETVLVFLSLLWAASLFDESIQGFLPRRSFGERDIAVDLLAGAAALCCAGIGKPRQAAAPSAHRTAILTATIPMLAALAFMSLALSRTATLYIPPPLWIFAPILAAGFAALAIAALSMPKPSSPASDEPGRDTAAAAAVLAFIAIVITGTFSIASLYPAQFH
jgi:hypothetical protein